MPTSIEKWQPLTTNKNLLDFVNGLFERIGVEVEDTGERFTVVHKGDRVELRDGVDAKAVDYTISIGSSQVDRLAHEAAKPTLSELEKYRIMAELFTPAAAATLRNPRLGNPLLRKFAGAETLMHACMKSPDPAAEPDACHTLIWAGGQWLVIPGRHGKPERTFTMSVEQVAEYQRHAMEVLKDNSLGNLLKFGSWYRQWRKGVSSSQEAA